MSGGAGVADILHCRGYDAQLENNITDQWLLAIIFHMIKSGDDVIF